MCFFFSSRRRHTRCALVTGVQTCALPISSATKFEFIGLETPPPVTHDRDGKRFVLKAHDLGSLDIGSPVYFRRINVGRVIGYKLDDSGGAVNVEVFIDAPNDKFVTRGTRFWNASGVDLSVDGSGLKQIGRASWRERVCKYV